MGFLKMLRNINNAEGAREAIRMAYQKHYRLAGARGLAPHQTALFGALGARWKTAGRLASEPQLWAEVAPFVCMAPEVGREALAEYVVCIERPQEGRIGWLREQLNSSLLTPYDCEEASDARDVAARSLAFLEDQIHWVQLLRDEVLESLRTRAAQLSESEDADGAAASDSDSASGLRDLDALAAALGVPQEVFALNASLEDVLSGWSKAELLVLNGRIGNFRRSDKIAHLHAALEMVTKRLSPLLPDPGDDLNPEALKAALFKLYGDR